MNGLRLLGFLLLLSIGGTADAIAAEKVTYYYTDAQGTPLVAVDGATGAQVSAVDYRPYGAQTLGSPQDGPGYTGHVSDADTALVYMQARYYDPQIGRFLSIDPATPSIGNPLTFNRFSYGANNPIRFIDLDGRRYAEAWAKQGVVVGATTVALASVVADVGSGGLNIPATPIEVVGGGIAGGALFGAAGKLADKIVGTDGDPNTPTYTDVDGNKVPFKGPPGSTVRGGTKSRTYGPDGYPKTDREEGHPDEKGPGSEDHCHDWKQCGDGKPPSHTDRGPPRAPQPGDPPPPRGPNVPPPKTEL